MPIRYFPNSAVWNLEFRGRLREISALLATRIQRILFRFLHDFQGLSSLVCSSSLGRGTCFAGDFRFSIPFYCPAHANAKCEVSPACDVHCNHPDRISRTCDSHRIGLWGAVGGRQQAAELIFRRIQARRTLRWPTVSSDAAAPPPHAAVVRRRPCRRGRRRRRRPCCHGSSL